MIFKDKLQENPTEIGNELKDTNGCNPTKRREKLREIYSGNWRTALSNGQFDVPNRVFQKFKARSLQTFV